MTAEQLASLAGIILSLLFGYFPGLQAWYDTRTSQEKALVMAGVLVLGAGGSLALACNFESACLTSDWRAYWDALLAALVANVSTYILLVRPFHNAPAPKKEVK